jgi:bifunctional UDP-N-acetylglucosamine pyrophosphorylase/glucosamine-1-phosphate N-acetyltransferase
MKAVVLAAGEGTRMRPLSRSRPKPMLPVGDRPLVAHTVEGAISAGADEIVLVVGYSADDVREYFGDDYAGVPIRYAVQEEQAGTADAVRAAADSLDGPFMVLNGDNLYDQEALADLVTEAPSVAAVRVEDPSNYGVLETRNGHVTGVQEKPEDPPSDLANAGAYTFPAEATEWLSVPRSERGEYELTDVLAEAVDACQVTPVTVERWMDVGRPWELLEANCDALAELDRNLAGDVSEDARVEGTVVVEEGATVESGVVIEGPALVREGASVGPNAYIRGATVLGPGAHVGHAVEVKNSVLMAGATAGHLAYVGDSILGEDVNLGAGTTIANLRHDGEPVRHTVKGERVSTGRRKFGAVFGEGAKTGVNTSIDAGVTLSPGTRTAPNEAVMQDI